MERTRGAVLATVSPLLFDVAIPVGLYYLLTALGVSDAPALIVSALPPGIRAVLNLFQSRKVDSLAIMMVALFGLSLVLLAVTGSPRALLLRESFGTVLVGLWCLIGAWTARPLTFYTARPFVTRGQPEALAAWDRLADTSPPFRRIQRRLSLVWGVGLLAEAAVRVVIVLYEPVHTAAGLVNIPAIVIIVGLCVLSGPLGGVELHRLVAADIERSREAEPGCATGPVAPGGAETPTRG